jgi:hypothetical protein
VESWRRWPWWCIRAMRADKRRKTSIRFERCRSGYTWSWGWRQQAGSDQQIPSRKAQRETCFQRCTDCSSQCAAPLVGADCFKSKGRSGEKRKGHRDALGTLHVDPAVAEVCSCHLPLLSVLQLRQCARQTSKAGFQAKMSSTRHARCWSGQSRSVHGPRGGRGKQCSFEFIVYDLISLFQVRITT